MTLHDDAAYLALAARDARFDGRFFVGVTTTGIYCRPVCRVRTPLRRNCRFFANAASAERAGFRPCLRCRPELAPGLSFVDSANVLAQHAARLLEQAVHDGAALPDIARRIGVTERHLRRIFREAHGVSPIEYVTTQRLLLAKRLLTDTTLPVTEVALASGFASVRRFNAAFAERYRLSPSALRREGRGETAPISGALTARLAWRPPYDVDGVLRFLGQRCMPGVEAVEGLTWRRTIALDGWPQGTARRAAGAAFASASAGNVGVGVGVGVGAGAGAGVGADVGVNGRRAGVGAREAAAMETGHAIAAQQAPKPAEPNPPATADGSRLAGWLSATFDPDRGELRVTLSPSLTPAIGMVLERVRQALDLDADPQPIDAALAELPGAPGTRVPNGVDGFETAVRVILGQQVTVAAARTLAARLVQQLGTPVCTPWPGLSRLFPSPQAIADADPDVIGRLGIVRQRVRALQALAGAVRDGRLALHRGAPLAPTLDALRALPGIGEWTLQLIAMRALAWPDAFAGSDIGVLHALGTRDIRAAQARAEAWRPWRAYAVMRLWQERT